MKLKKNILAYLRTYRALNLIMIAFTQFVVSQYIIIYYDFYILSLISLSTLSIALAGYWLNDIADISIDIANKKQGLINEKNKSLYSSAAYSLMSIGLLLGFYLCFITSLSLFWYYIFAVISLILYAYFLSKYKFIGNIIVSLLVGLVVLLCFYIELSHIAFTPKFYTYKVYSVWLYATAAFSVNWLREVLKDIEDIEGDKLNNRISLATLFGVRLSKILVSLISLLFAVFLAIYTIPNFTFNSFFIILSVILFLFVFISTYSLIAHEKKQFTHLSFLSKLALFLGLCLPIFY